MTPEQRNHIIETANALSKDKYKDHPDRLKLIPVYYHGYIDGATIGLKELEKQLLESLALYNNQTATILKKDAELGKWHQQFLAYGQKLEEKDREIERLKASIAGYDAELITAYEVINSLQLRDE